MKRTGSRGARYIQLKLGGLSLEIEYDVANKCFSEVCITSGRSSVNITKFTDDLFTVTGVDYRTYTSLTDSIEDALRERGLVIGD